MNGMPTWSAYLLVSVHTSFVYCMSVSGVKLASTAPECLASTNQSCALTYLVIKQTGKFSVNISLIINFVFSVFIKRS